MTTATPAKKIAVIFSGEVFDGSDATHPRVRDLEGNAFDVRVRAMPARHLGRVLALCADEAGLIELVSLVSVKDESGAHLEWAAVSAEWVDNLDPDSHVLLQEAAKRLNFSRAALWGQRQIEAKQFQAPLLLKADEMLSPVVEKMAHLLISSLQSSGALAAPTTKSSTDTPSTSS